MCEKCFADEGRPVELPENAEEVLQAFCRLINQPGFTDAGPLFRVIEHFDVEDEFLTPFPYGPPLYPAEHIDVVNEVLELLRAMPRYHRAACVAYWLDYFEDPTLCPYRGCAQTSAITHEILMWPKNEAQNYNPSLTSAQRTLACEYDTLRIVAHQQSPKVDRNYQVFTYDTDSRERIQDVTGNYNTPIQAIERGLIR